MALTNLTKVQTVGIGSNIEVVGVVTTGQFKSGTSNLHSSGVELTNLNVSGIATIGGNLSIGGTLTYEDVTNIDSIGIVTARAGVNVSGGQLDVGSNIKLGNAGVITATTFKGNGDFVELDVDGHTNLDNVSIVGVTTFNGLSSNDVIRVRSADSNGNSVVNILSEGTTGNSRILFSDTAATSGDGWISYSHNDRALTFTTAGTSNERLRIDSSGNVNIGAKDYNTHSASIDSLQIGHALNLYEDSYSSGTDNYVILANNLYYNSGNKYMRNDEASRIMMQGGAFYFQNAVAGTAGNAITLVDVLRITSGGYVGINETSPDNALHIKSTTDTQQIKLENTVSTGRAQIRYVNPQADWQQGIIGGTTEGDFITYTSAAKNIRFYTNNSEKVRITSDGTTTFDPSAGGTLKIGGSSAHTSKIVIADNNGTGNGNCLVEGGDGTDFFTIQSNGNIAFASGKGIDFSATANSSGSMGNELFSDYEQGSWSPTLTSGTATWYQQQWYTKIGRMVTCYFYMYNFSDTSSSTHVRINGLPYVNNNARESSFHISTGGNPSLGSGSIGVFGRIGVTGNTTQITLYRGFATTTASLTHAQLNSGHYYCTFQYATDA